MTIPYSGRTTELVLVELHMATKLATNNNICITYKHTYTVGGVTQM